MTLTLTLTLISTDIRIDFEVFSNNTPDPIIVPKPVDKDEKQNQQIEDNPVANPIQFVSTIKTT